MFTTVILASVLLAAASDESTSQPDIATKAVTPHEKIAAGPPKKQVVPRTLVRLFDERQYNYTGGQYNNQLFKYRLFTPRSLEPTTKYPLLVWMHGFRRAGSDNTRSLLALDSILRDRQHIDKYRFFILVVQCPKDNSSWFQSYATESGAGAPDDMSTVLFEIINKTMRECPIDQDRVYLAGGSAGGTGCLEMAMRYPELFAAILPMGSSHGDTSRVAQLANIPIWMFHNADDQAVSPVADQEMASAVRHANGTIHLTLLSSKTDNRPTTGANHDCWTKAMRDCEAIDWLLSQKRGGSCWTPPGCPPWRWWHVLTVPCLFLACVRLAWHFKQRLAE